MLRNTVWAMALLGLGMALGAISQSGWSPATHASHSSPPSQALQPPTLPQPGAGPQGPGSHQRQTEATSINSPSRFNRKRPCPIWGSLPKNS